MSNITIRPMEPEDWNAVSEIYSEGIATEHATFQTTCPPYTAWDAFHIKDAASSFWTRRAGRLGRTAAGRPPLVLPGAWPR